jgi:hypothetical protein
LIVIAISVAACSQSSDASRVSAALQSIESRIASDMSIQFVEPRLGRQEPNGQFYVCGTAILNRDAPEPYRLTDAQQRFVATVFSKEHAIALFDGSGLPEQKDEFQRLWDARCESDAH